jgi:hypothetical protein
MATTPPGQMKTTLSLTSLTSNAMALIAPGAFLWLTFAIQANTGTTSAGDVDGRPDRVAAVPGYRRLLRRDG